MWPLSTERAACSCAMVLMSQPTLRTHRDNKWYEGSAPSPKHFVLNSTLLLDHFCRVHASGSKETAVWIVLLDT